MMISIGILDQSRNREGDSFQQSIEETIQLAKYAEKFGFERFWLAEHHGFAGFASAAPDILLARIGKETSTIKLGTGGILLRQHRAIQILERFATLEAFYPGRIELGIARATGTNDKLKAFIDKEMEPFDDSDESYEKRMEILLDVLDKRSSVNIPPLDHNFPIINILGSGSNSAKFAARYGLPFSFAHFINKKGMAQIFNEYRMNFRPSKYCKKPFIIMAVNACCAEEEKKAKNIAMSDFLRHELLRSSRHMYKEVAVPFWSEEKALQYPYTEEEKASLKKYFNENLVGTPEQIKEKILHFHKEFAIDSFLMLTWCYKLEDTINSLKLVAEAFNLGH